MNALAAEGVISAFLIFCRIGGCLMLMPGVGGRHLSPQFRLFLAIGLSLAFVPLLQSSVEGFAREAGSFALLGAIGSEAATGAMIGLLARIFFLALQSMASAIAQAIGLASMAGTMIEDDEALPPVATLLAFSATTLLFISDQHLELVRALFDSYRRLPPGTVFTARLGLSDVVDQLTTAFLLALRIASPFIVYSIIVNFAVGITNKFTPQLPVYFIATPFITAGGMLLLYATVDQLLAGFMMAFSQWLAAG
ncbi:MAG: flagellar biosynthetic protein FliR [Rhizobiales bacterium 24-66-13]|jgi:flagellar biosynthetic protein FliR|uniref:flagellar biosynthesis protein FliR n=1 Tax=Roseixanthobacter finlandensis TaxID=3119922 RepID=UPI000BD6DDA9|nr:MAG: flagellar biosynthetic protein FliR [Azorhizobium sp. 12-66-6]OYZ71904.1 MAG: flagellar biosynthetic protein FliR [Rhizobiales bacterium 24-66-13]